ncbi:HNH endonuclease [Streptomyces sp. NPDC051315]|uniref:HNH endonuclease n=1 Tax=Streptomyces sp. NPDC051315 TaxID=3365650 RepID=UPI00378E69A7
MAVSKRLRYEILRRDNHTCRYCGASAPDTPLRVDHVIPIALGGTDEPSNLVTSCEPCNSGKSSASPDAHHVADVADDALRWSAAMQQAAEELRAQNEPKRAYRDAFEQAWNGWTYENGGKRHTLDLPDGWKTSLDNFREAGLPVEVWPDIIEKAMTNKTVTASNTFRYCCGIGWRMVRELQDRAKAIAGGKPSAAAAPLDSVVQAALDIWADAAGDEASGETRASILATAKSARERDVDAHLILEAAQYAAWYGLSKIGDAIGELEVDRVAQAWTMSWLTTTGEYPDEQRSERVRQQVDQLLGAGVYVTRVERAAAYAGSRRSALLHFGLSDDEREVTGVTEYFAKVIETWREAFHAAARRWPNEAEHSALLDSIRRIGTDGDIYIEDVYPAAAAAGSYQDPDISTCLTRHLSVFEIAARPLAPAS